MGLQDAQKALAMVERAKKKGRAAQITFTRTVDGEYDPSTGGSSEVTLTWTGLAVILPASQGAVQSFDVKFEQGTLIESKLRALLIPALSVERVPQPGDGVEFPDGLKGQLIGCTPLDPDGANPIIYQGTVQL